MLDPRKIKTVSGDAGLCNSGFTSHVQDPERINAGFNKNEVDICRIFIRNFIEPAPTFHRSTSYGWKHAIEEASGKYISNGAFILAASLEGITIKQLGINAALKLKRKRFFQLFWTHSLKGNKSAMGHFDSNNFRIPDYWPYESANELKKIFQA